MCDEWEEDDVPYNPSRDLQKSREMVSPRSDRKRAFDSRGNSDRYNDYSRDRQNSSRGYSDRRYDDRREKSREFSRRDDLNSSNGPKEEFMIKSFDAGTVIGKGGSTIREIQSKYNVRVSIDKNVAEFGRAKVVITGRSSENITDARKFIEDLLPKEMEVQNSSQNGVNDDGVIDWDAINKRCDEATKERWAKCPLLVKNFYKEHAEVTKLTAEEVKKFRADNMNIQVARTFEDQAKDSEPIPNPVIEFYQAFDEYPDLMQEIKKQGFKNPSPIQAQGWPV